MSLRPTAPGASRICSLDSRHLRYFGLLIVYIATWFDKPELVSAVKCALKGWINEGLDILHCKVCAARLIVKIRGSKPSFGTFDSNEAGNAYVERLTEAHSSSCPWRERACQGNFIQSLY